MKKTWMIIFALLLSVLLLGCAGAEETSEEFIGTFVSQRASYCPDCDIDVYTGKYSLHWHVWFCPQCGQGTPNDASTHEYASCDSPDTCQICGASGVEVDNVHCNRNELIQHSDTQHWVVCADCGAYQDYHFEHWSYCDNPTVCAFCKETDCIITADNIIHSDEATQEQRYDDTQHWWYCTGCGADKLWPAAHEGYCDENVCRTCDQEGVTLGEIYHVDLDYAWVKMNDTYCGRVCNSCGGFDDYILPHRADCSTPDTCSNCGSVGITAEYLHDYERTFDKTHHWYACTECGETADKGRHEANCFTPDVCYMCEAEGIDALLREHGNWYTEFVPSHNATHCWSECPECGERFDEERHYTTDCTKPDVCEWCGNSGVDCVVYHSYETFDMSGGHFYTANAAYDENGHWWTCADCGKKTVYDHAVNAANLCVACGYQPAEPCKHPVASWTYETDGEYAHQAWCGDCGAQMFFDTQDGPSEYGDHSDVCSEPDVCRFCGAEDAVMMDTVHSTKTEICHDTTMHWQGCTDCGEVLDLRTMKKHTYKDYVCTECGYTPFTDILGTFTYSEDSAWCSDCERDVYTGVYTRTECWFACPDCCKTIHEFGLHYAACDAPEACYNCGATGVTISRVEHEAGAISYDDKQHWGECGRCEKKLEAADHTLMDLWNDAEHWKICSECGYEPAARAAHTAVCVAQNVCSTCGQRDIIISEVVHEWTDTADGRYHWTECMACGSIKDNLVVEHQFTDLVKISDTLCGAKCKECGYHCEDVVAHEASCTAPDVCVNCGGTEVIAGEIKHNDQQKDRVKVSDTECATICRDCNEMIGEPGPHTAYCDAPDRCIDCGATDVVLEIECSYDSNNYEMYHDEYYHWEGCAICGTRFDRVYGHEAECSNPNVCYYCGASDVYMEEIWHEETKYEFDQYCHWEVCDACGEKTAYEKHSRSCMDEPGVCRSCKASGDEVELITKHSSRVNWTSIDAMQHQPTCARCGELAGDPVNHLANCNEPTHCIQCGADQVTADYSHEIDYADDPVYDNTHHWYVCTICGEPAEGERHYNSHDCTDPKTCTYCDAENVDTILYHSYDCFDDGVEDKIGPVFSSDEGHWWHCNGCGDETVYPHDFGSGNICVTCWYVKDNRVPGDADQDGVVTLEDVTLLLAYLADSTVDIHLGNSNVNDDTGVDADDLLTLLQLVSGWDIELK